MGLTLFTGDDGKKRLSSLSGGEATRLVFTRLSIEQPNVLVLDEPTNHLDLESIEALVEGLTGYTGTLILVSHDRWFVGQLANRVLEIRSDGITDYEGTYEEYVHACGDDHLDVDQVVLKAKKAERRKGQSPKQRHRSATRTLESQLKRSRKRLEEVTARIETAEAEVKLIDELFCEPDYFQRTAAAEIRTREQQRSNLQNEITDLMTEWERLEDEIASLERKLDELAP
jgi:ABC-type multidrug transport system ATPase subunit